MRDDVGDLGKRLPGWKTFDMWTWEGVPWLDTVFQVWCEYLFGEIDEFVREREPYNTPPSA